MNKMQTPSLEGNGLWNYKQVAAYLSVSESQAKRLLIPCIKLGRSVRFDPAEVRDWVSAHSVRRRTGATNG